MHRFFVEDKNIFDEKILIEGEDVIHISKVLRLCKGEKILVSNKRGNEYLCKIDELNKKEVICVILECIGNETESPLEIILFQGLPKAQKMDLIIQKCVELGITKIQPVISERVVIKVEYKDISNKIDRWNRISMEAAKQSNRGIIPIVAEPVKINEAIDELKKMDLPIVPYEKEKARGLKDTLLEFKNAKKIGIFIGPEGGFSETEINMCIENNIIPVTLGPRILRTETAGFSALSIIQYEIGDMGGNI